MILNYVVIPYRGKLEMTEELAWTIHKQGDTEKLFLMNNGAPTDTIPGPWETRQCEDWNLHKMLNWGWAIADLYSSNRGFPVCNVGVFNNDISIGDDFVERLAIGLRGFGSWGAVCGSGDYTNESTVVSRVRSGHHFEGPAVMFRGETAFRFDEQYEWWCGDTDIAAQIESAGLYLGQVANAHFTHLDGGSVSVKEYAGQIDYWNGCHRDVDRFHAKWPMIPRGSHCIPEELLPDVA